jgi:hypothetical protein
MAVKVNSIKKRQLKKAQEIHRLENRNKKLYHPCPGEKGLHCEGERFDFVVNWEVREKEIEKSFAE